MYINLSVFNIFWFKCATFFLHDVYKWNGFNWNVWENDVKLFKNYNYKNYTNKKNGEKMVKS